jgi:hypothetical protein
MNTDIPQQYLAIYKDQSSRRSYGEGVVVNDGDLITFTTAEDILELPKSIHEIQKFPNDVNPRKNFIDDGKLIFEIVETDKKNRRLQE